MLTSVDLPLKFTFSPKLECDAGDGGSESGLSLRRQAAGDASYGQSVCLLPWARVAHSES